MQAVCGKPWAGTSDTQLFFYFCCTTFSLESLQCRPRVIETLPPELSQAFEIWTAPECILRRCNIHLKFLKKSVWSEFQQTLYRLELLTVIQ